MIQLNSRFRDYTFVLLIAISSAFVAACGGGGGGGGGPTPSPQPPSPQPSSPLANCTDNCNNAPVIDSQVRIDRLTPGGGVPPEESQNDDDSVGSGGDFESDTASGEESTVTYQAGTRNLMAMAPNAAANDPPLEFTLEERGDSSAVLPDDIEDADTSTAYYSFVEPTPTGSSLVRSATTRQDGDVEYGYYLLENEYSVAGLYANDRLRTDPTADPYFYSASIWGRATPNARVRGAGQATYTGPVIGYCEGCDNGQTGATAESGDYLALGGVEITADFARDQITGTMSLSAYDAAAGLTALQNVGATSEVSPGNVLGVVDLRLEDGMIDNNGFSGDVNYVSADNSANEVGVFNAIADTDASDDDGDFSGKFYGYSGSEVAGVANIGGGDASLEVAFTADRAPDSQHLAAPTNLVSEVTGTRTTATVTLTWDAAVDAAEYELYRDGTLVGTVPATAATTYTYTDTPGVDIASYQILARNGDLESQSPELIVTTLPAGTCTDNCNSAPSIDTQARIALLTPGGGVAPPEESQNDADGVGSGGEFNSDPAIGEESTVTYQAGASTLMAPAPNAAAGDPLLTFTLEERRERGDSSTVLFGDIEDADTSVAYYRFGDAPTTNGFYLLENEYSVAGLYANDGTGSYFESASHWGRATPNARMRGGGQATYTGPVIGYCEGCDNGLTGTTAESGDYLALGGVAITADFARDQITGTMSLSAYDAAAGLTALQNVGATSEVSPGDVLGVVDLKLEDGMIDNNGFSGDVNYVSADNSANEVGVFNAIADTDANDDDGDFSGKFYGYSGSEIAGVASMENSGASLEVAFTADRAPDSQHLAAPTNLVSEVTGTRTTATVTLTWDAVVDAAEYELYRDGTLVGTVPATAATTYTYIDTPGVDIASYQILARNGDLESQSPALIVTTPLPAGACTDNCNSAPSIDTQARIALLTPGGGVAPPEESQNDADGVGSGGEFNSDTASGEESTVTYQAGASTLMAPAPNAAAGDPLLTFTLEERRERGDSSTVLFGDIEDADTSVAYYRFGDAPTTNGFYLLENEYSVAGLYANDGTGSYFESASHWGRATPNARMRGGGQATYTGPVIGYCEGCDNGLTGTTAESGDYLALGGVAITADFARDQITGTMSLSAYDAAAGLTALQNAGATSEVSPGEVLGVVDLRLEDGMIDNNGFSGDVNYISADNSANEVGVFNAIADTDASDDDGDFSGKFYGYSGSEIAGVANVDGTNVDGGDASLEVAFTADRAPDSQPLAAPTNLVSEVAGTGTTATATLTWDAVVDAAEYELYRDGMLVDTVTVTDTAATTYTYIDNPGDTASHSYQILARNGDLESRTSELTLTGTTSVQVGTGTSTIDALTGDTFVTPVPIYASDSSSRLESDWRYYPSDNESQYEGFIYRRGGTSAWYIESSTGGPGYADVSEEYPLFARDEDAFPTDKAPNALAFAVYDDSFFALEGEYAANLGWYFSDPLTATVGLATPVSSLPSSGSAIWRGKAIGIFIVGVPENRDNRFSRVIRDADGLRGGDGARYFVEGDIAVNVDFFADDIDGQTILRAYAESEENGRGYFSHLAGGNDGIATRDEDVVGTLNMEFEGDLYRTDALDHYEGYVTEINNTPSDVFDALYYAYDNNFMYNYLQGSLYGPNFEETAGDLQMSTCSVTPIYDVDGNFTSCTGDLYYLGVGFVTQETAGLPLSTTPVPEQGDTKTAALIKLNMEETDLEILAIQCFNASCDDSADVDVYENFRDGGLEQLKVYLYDYASFGEWERWVVDADGSEFKQVGFLALGDNQVSTLPTTGTADYVIRAGRIANLTQPDDGFFYGSGSLSADFGTSQIAGNMVLTPRAGRGDDTGGITLAFDNGRIASDATFSGGITVSGASGAFANINTGANGQFAGAFYDDPGTYDASAAPAEVAGTFDSVMDSEGNEWGGGFIGN